MAEKAATLNVFISYGRADARELALRLRDDLMAVGHSAWLDVSEIAGGVSWSRQIEDAIEHCDVALALMSLGSYESEWCRAEQLRVIRKGKRLIPILVQPNTERPLQLEHLNYLDFSDLVRYDEMFRDLLSDITAGQAFRLPQSHRDEKAPAGASPFKAPSRRSKPKSYASEKRNAGAFRSHLADLRSESWLGSRYWWPYFLFHFCDVHSVVEILKSDELCSPFESGEDFHSRWDKFVRLYFRPRTPDLFRAEGFRPLTQQHSAGYSPMPVYLLFDMEAVICMPESRFSEGDPARLKKTYKTPAMFRDFPFDAVYHDSWFMPDERDEIMMSRRAQVVIPDRMGLESLQYIWCRSPAEYETLRTLLPEDIWRGWRDKVTARTDFNLFNRKWLYVDSVALAEKQVRFSFNRCGDDTDKGPFTASATVESANGKQFEWSEDDFCPKGDLVLDTDGGGAYSVRLMLDGDLAYAGEYVPEKGAF